MKLIGVRNIQKDVGRRRNLRMDSGFFLGFSLSAFACCFLNLLVTRGKCPVSEPRLDSPTAEQHLVAEIRYRTDNIYRIDIGDVAAGRANIALVRISFGYFPFSRVAAFFTKMNFSFAHTDIYLKRSMLTGSRCVKTSGRESSIPRI